VLVFFHFEPDTLLRIREDKRKGVYVEGLSEWVVRSPKEVYGLMQRGASTRATAPTKMNEISSRSHAVFIIILEQLEYVEEADKGAAAPEADGGGDMAQVFKVGKLNLVDLAGSERVRLTGATGQRLEESRKINQSLSALGNVIAALTTSGRQHIPYRDSKLTRILEDSLGGNCKTTMMAMISPALEAYVESLSTLKFANRAKNIKNEAHVNEDLDQKALLRKYEKEIKKLRSELEQKTKTVGDKRRLLQLQHQKEQAEKDKESVLIQLQLQSEEFMRAKEDKERLEQRLSLMESQLLEGGSQQHADAEAFQRALQKEQKRLQHEYDERVAKLEAQGGGGVKNILEQQRQVLTKLTERLRKRDECIARLQDELDA
jgi:kinesin family protein 3/17